MRRCGESSRQCCASSLTSGSSSPRVFLWHSLWRWIRAGCCWFGWSCCSSGSNSSSSNLLEPWVYGASTGLSSVALIAAATFWTWLWGPVGLLLSTPLTVCLVVLGRHVPQLEFLDVMLGNQPVLAPDETFYQRLLANDPEEATEQAEEFVKERSLAEFFDEVAIPALIRAQVDSDDGALLPERRLDDQGGYPSDARRPFRRGDWRLTLRAPDFSDNRGECPG